VTDEERVTALIAVRHNPLYCPVNGRGCPRCVRYYRILLTPTTGLGVAP
jgi:hypothetical protein